MKGQRRLKHIKAAVIASETIISATLKLTIK